MTKKQFQKRLKLKTIVTTLFIIVQLPVFSQKTVTGIITHFYSKDSIKPLKNIYSIETYSPDGKLTYKCQYFYYDTTRKNISYFYGDTLSIYVHGSGDEKDSTILKTDPKTKLTYCIENTDTSSIDKEIHHNGKIIKVICIKNCDFTTMYSYHKNKIIRTVITPRDTSYWISKVDKKGRLIYATVGLKNLNQKEYNAQKIKYNDKKKTKTIVIADKGEKPSYIIKYYYDENWIPIRMEETQYKNGEISLKITVEYS